MGSTQLNTFVYFKMYKTGSGIGATSSSTPLTQAVTPCLSDGLVTHTYTLSTYTDSLYFFFLLCDKIYLLWFVIEADFCAHACMCVCAGMHLVTISSSPLTLITVFGNNLGCWGGLHCNHTQPAPVAIDSWLGYWPSMWRVGAEEWPGREGWGEVNWRERQR